MTDTVVAETPKDAETIIVEAAAPGVQRIILHRPDRLNALTQEMLRCLHNALESAAANASVRCVVLTGAGRAFCAGQDLNDRDPRKLASMPNLEAIQKELFHPVVETVHTMPKPVIATVNGIAAGAGASLALAADIVLAGRSAKFAFSFSKVGLSVDAGLGWHLTQAIGSARARGLLMTGGTLTAQQAEDAGLIWRSVEDGELTDHATTLATQLATGPTQAYAAIKSAIAAAEHAPDLQSYLQREAQLQGEMGRTNDYREGVLAFLEKRSPNFSGT